MAPCDDDLPVTPSERVAVLVLHLAHGDAFTTRRAATLVGLPMPSAWRLLARLARVLPLYQDAQGAWRLLERGGSQL